MARVVLCRSFATCGNVNRVLSVLNWQSNSNLDLNVTTSQLTSIALAFQKSSVLQTLNSVLDLSSEKGEKCAFEDFSLVYNQFRQSGEISSGISLILDFLERSGMAETDSFVTSLKALNDSNLDENSLFAVYYVCQKLRECESFSSLEKSQERISYCRCL